MNCPKCSGLMVAERFADYFLMFYAWKCLNCGTVVDNTILRNKRKKTFLTPKLATVK